MKSIVTNQTILAKKKLQNHNRKKAISSRINIYKRAKELHKDSESVFIANRANQDEIENYLI
jgi:hypothetical protein